jgi:hypothetical protein
MQLGVLAALTCPVALGLPVTASRRKVTIVSLF